jgi:hypothetical protein
MEPSDGQNKRQIGEGQRQGVKEKLVKFLPFLKLEPLG